MKIRLNTLLFLFFALLLLSREGFAQQNNFITFGVEEGMPHTNVYSISQDSRGYLWVGTDGGGVSRFDGKKFVTYTTKQGLSGNVVRCIFEDSQGNLWFGTDNGVTLYNGHSFQVIGEADSLKGATILTIAEDAQGNLWFGTDDAGINRLHWDAPGQFTISNYNENNSSLFVPTVFDLEVDANGLIWTASFNGGIQLLKVENDSVTFDYVYSTSSIPSNYTLAIEADHDGNVWVGTYDAGAYRLSPTQDGEWNVITYPSLQMSAVWDIEVDHRGHVWFSTYEHGIIRYFPEESTPDSAVFAHYTDGDGLPGNQFLKVFQDREQNVWFGSNGDGLVKFVGDHFAHYTVDNGLPNDKVTGISQDHNGHYWIATDGGGLSRMKFTAANPVITTWNEDDGLPSNLLTSVAIGRYETNHFAWVSTIKDGISKFDGHKFVNFDEQSGLGEQRVNQVFVDRKGIVWLATADGIAQYDGGQFLQMSTEDLLLEDEGVNAIIEDFNGELWLGTAGALVHYPGEDELTTYDQVEGLEVPDVNCIAEGPDGDIWIGTNGGGLYRFFRKNADNMPIEFVADDSLLASNALNSLLFYNDTTLIVGTDKGFDRLTLDQAGNILSVRHYDATDGFFGIECNDNALFKDAFGFIWFGTGAGATRYDPSLEIIPKSKPQVHVTDLMLSFKEVDWVARQDSVSPFFNLPRNLVLPYNQNHLTFHFAGISMYNPEKIRYSYKLENQGEEWSPWSPANSATFSGLSHGTYSFKLKAVNAQGIESDEVTYTFEISPPWYQTTAFYVGCAIFLVLVFYLYLKVRERKLQQEKRILEEKVDERTAEVVKQKEEIEEKNQEITDSINYASKIQEAILPPITLSETFKDSFVLFHPKDIVSGDFYWMVEKDDHIFFTVADCTGHGVPGAFMSMIGTALFNEAVNVKRLVKPHEILFDVRAGIIRSLKQTGKEGEQKDGMDVALCTWYKHEGILEYSGANNSLYVIRRGDEPVTTTKGEEGKLSYEEGDLKLYEFKASKQPVGYYTAEMDPYELHRIQIKEGDTLYAFSDGYADQFGGPKGKKFMYKPFKRLLVSLFEQDMEAQRKRLDSELKEWRGEIEQIDDVCVMGVKF